MKLLFGEEIKVNNYSFKKPVNKSLEELIKKNIRKNARRMNNKKKKERKNQKRKISGVSVISVVNNHTHLEELIENYSRQNYTNKELVVALRYDANDIEISVLKDKLKDSIKFIKVTKSEKIFKCLNYAVARSRYNIISIFHISTFYGKNYLSELVSLYNIKEADIIGKTKYYVYLKNNGVLAVSKKGTEDNYINYIYSSTLSFRKELMNTVKFIESKTNIEKQFYMDCLKKGFKVYSSDRNSFVSIKTKENEQLIDEKFLQNFTIIARNSDYTGI